MVRLTSHGQNRVYPRCLLYVSNVICGALVAQHIGSITRLYSLPTFLHDGTLCTVSGQALLHSTMTINDFQEIRASHHNSVGTPLH